MSKKKFWFVAKNYGWGWRPSTWEGWAMIIGYIVLMLGVVYQLTGRSNEDINAGKEILIPFSILTLALTVVSYKKGEKPEWRWGGKPLSK